MESPGVFPESPIEPEDAAYPCKGCGEILEEGKAFELAGNRWHIDCFRCNNCGTLLDSDANLLLLGDGSLICNNCTYSCNACGNKIEDLAILTGDQAFCATCFKCRNCKRKIENLKYARTSQGIFCMTCHESLMARRKKKTKAAAAQLKLGANAQSPMLLDKSLPSLPPNALPEDLASPDADTPSESYTDTPTELSPRPRPPQVRSSSSRSRGRDLTPPSAEDGRKGKLPVRGQGAELIAPENLTLPSTTYTANRHSYISQASDVTANGDASDSFDIPLLLDTGSAPPAGSSKKRPSVDCGSDEPPRDGRSSKGSRTYRRDEQASSRPSTRQSGNGRRMSSPIGSQDPDGGAVSSEAPSPRAAQGESLRSKRDESRQGKGLRQHHIPHSGSTSVEPSSGSGSDDTRIQHARAPGNNNRGKPGSAQHEQFRLQEVPKNKKSGGSARSSRSDTASSPLSRKTPPPGASRSFSSSVLDGGSRQSEQAASAPPTGSARVSAQGRPNEMPRASSDSKTREEMVDGVPSSTASSPGQLLHKPKREDSLRLPRQIARKEIGGHVNKTSQHSSSTSEQYPSASMTPDKSSMSSDGKTHGRTAEADYSSGNEAQFHPPRTHSRLPAKATVDESFTAPRVPPQPPHPPPRSPNHSISTMHTESSRNGDEQLSPGLSGLPQYSAGGDFSMEEDMARILGSNDEGATTLLRQVSSVVKHGRSFSDMEGRTRHSPGKWPRSPMTSQAGSPFVRDTNHSTTVSPESKEENASLKHELRRSAQKIAELEARVNGTADITSLDTKLREKRSTVAFLDSQKELMVRELEVLTEHMADAKKNHRPYDVSTLTSKVVREFALSLKELKDSYGPEIEALIHQKNQLTEEVSTMAKAREQAIQETEQLNLKNAQLADLNNELTHQIQERYKAHREQAGSFDGRSGTNGLGIYAHQFKERSDLSVDTRSDLRPGTGYGSSANSMPNVMAESHDGEPAALLASPHVVNIRKGQVKKFNWKKGGQTVAKGVSKGFKGAFSSTNQANPQQQPYSREGSTTEGIPYNSLPAGSPGDSNPSRGVNDVHRQGLGFFGQKLGRGMPGKMPSHGNLNYLAAEASSSEWRPIPFVDAVADMPDLFGSELNERAEFERRQIPNIVTRCIEEVELRGMDIEGIYRKTGGNSQVKAIQEGFERNDDYDISDPGLDITAVTSVLKQYFRKLPTPLLTYEIYDSILESNGVYWTDEHDRWRLTMAGIGNEEKRALSLRAAVQQLPTHHRDCLEFLVFHLARVATRERENLMTPKNLAVVFAPTIMRDDSLEREMTDMHAKNTAIQFLIENNKVIFGGMAS
ncbi:MAG: Rho-type gtpase-activating protein [Caeruleum heppii]|nr:MAG: Rho-type gtpase-activating protein [Caeruleum heppii]